MKKTIRKVLSVVLALAMVITGINYTPSTVKADATVTKDGKTYVITTPSGNIVGLVINKDDTGFLLQWDSASGSIVTVSENGTKLQENIGNGQILLISNLQSLSTGTHTLTFTSNTGKVSTATLTIEGGSSGGGSGATEESPTTPENATWTKWGTSTEYSYYLASGYINTGNMYADTQGLYVALSKVPSVITLNGVTISNLMTDNGAHVKVSFSNLAGNGIYKLYLATSTEEIATVYIKKGNTEESTTVSESFKAPTDAFVYNFTDAEQGYKLGFTEPNKVTNEEGISSIRTDGVYTLKIGDKTIENINGTELSFDKKGKTIVSVDLSTLGLTAGETYSVNLTAKYGTSDSVISEKTYLKYTTEKTSPSYDDGIGMVYITTSRKDATKSINLYTDKSKDKVDTAIMVLNSNGTPNQVGAGTIKTRGNSTLNAQKKPYNISFNEEKDVFGMGSAKKWSLLANIMDKSLIRNQVAFNFHNYVEKSYQAGYAYTSKCKPVDLYIDGEYVGEYLLIESVETGKTRVDIDAENTENTEILLEIDGQGRDVATDAHLDARTTKYDMYFTINEPEGPGTNGTETAISDYNTKYGTKKTNVLNFLNEFETAVGEKNYTQIQQYIDIDSFVDFYITSELFKTKDIGFSSTRYYIKNGKLYAGPLWDLDLSAGNSDDGGLEKYDDLKAKNDNAWFGALLEVPEFEAAVEARFQQLLPKIEELVADGGDIDQTYNEVKTAAERNFSVAYNVWSDSTNGYRNGWKIDGLYGGSEVLGLEMYGNSVTHTTYKEYVDDYKTWMINRIAVLKGVYGDKALDLTEVTANTPAVDSTEGWTAKYGGNNATIANTFNTDKSLQYYIATSYANGGANNKFFVNDNVYGFYATGAAVSFSHCPADILTNGAYGFNAELMRQGVKSVWVNNEKLVSGTDYYIQSGNDVMAMTSEKFALGEDENSKVYYVTVRTADGTDYSWPILVKRVNTEEAPDLSNVTLPTDEGWTQVTTDEKLSLYRSKFYYPTDGVITNVAELKAVGSDITSGGAAENTLSTPVFGFSVNTGNNPEAIWIGTKKLSSSKYYINNNVISIVQSEFDLGEKAEDIFYVTLRYLDKDVTIPIKVTAGTTLDPSAITDWVAFDTRDGKSNESIYGTQYYVSESKLGVISKNTGVSGTYDGTKTEPQWNWNSDVSVYGKPVLGWICENGTKGVQVNGTFLSPNSEECAFGGNWVYINQSVFQLNEGERERIFTIRLYGNSDDEYFAMKVVNPNVVETTTEETTMVETTTEGITAPEDATWTKITDASDYYYYISDADASHIANKDVRAEDVYFAFKNALANIKSATLDNNTALSLVGTDGVAVPKTYLSKSGVVHKLTVVARDDTTVTLYLKLETPPDYKATSLLATTDYATKTASISWTPSKDAESAGYTYTVKVGELDASVTGYTATCDISTLTVGETYTVTVNTMDGEGKVVATATTTMKYKDPEAVDSTVTFDTSKWEYDRSEGIQWTKVENAVGYAIYVDGKLYQTIDNPDTLSIDVPAYAFANSENANGQKTTVGTHTTAIVALMDDDAVESALENMNVKRIMDSNSFPLYVNYVFGNQTDIWNNTGVDSVWNFTLCESAEDENIKRGANVKVTYNNAGAADLVFNDMGEHAGKDQAWTVKAAIYNQPIVNGELQNLSFDIYGPAALVGQKIMIHCFAEEWDRANNRYGEAIYDDKNVENSLYTFEATEDGKAVLHYSTSFTAKSDTYDLVFGLGLLKFGDSTDKSILLTDAVSKKVYGLTSLTPSPVVNTSNINNSSIFVSWQTDVPNHLESEYTYKVYIDGELAALPDGEDAYKNNMTFAGYGPGEHTVKVESIYDGVITSTQEKTVTIEDQNKPDLVVTDISIPDGEYHIGEEVTISVTVKNIGTAKAEGHGNLAIFAYVGDTSLGYQFAHHGETGLEHTLDVGESYTAQYKYTISKADEKGGYLFDIKAVVDGDKNYAAYESDPNNNSYTKTFKFYEPISTPTITNAGDHVKIDWNDHDDTNKNFIVSYTVEGESDPRTIETDGNISEIDLPTDVWLASGSQVIVTSVHTDGSSHVYSIGTALSDLVVSEVDIPKNAYAVGEVVPIKVTMKNVGVSTATPATGNLTIKPTKDGNILGTNVTPLYRYMAEDGLEQKLLVGEEYSYTFNYTVQQADKDAGAIQLGGMADADGNVTELDNENNITEVSLKIMDKGTLTLTSNNGEGPVSATWTAADENLVNGYKLKYTTDGTNYIEVPIYKTTTAEHEANVTYDENTGKYTYTFPAEVGLYNQSDVTVMVTFDEVSESATYYDFASDTAMVDLIITKVVGPNESSQPVKVKVNFDLTATVKNIGTAVIAPSTADLDGYGRHLFVTLIEQTGVPQKTSEGFYQGLTVGATTDILLQDVVINEQGKKDLVIMADHAGWYIGGDTSKPAGYIPESDETNNKFTYSVTAIIDQQPMDWTPLTVAQGSAEIYEFKIAQGTKDAHVEFKVVDTNNKELDYKDIVTKYIGYNGMYMSLGFNPNYSAIVVKQNDEEGQIISTVPYWAAITKKQVNSNIHDLATCSIMDVEGWDIDGIDAVTGKAVQKAKVPGTHFNADGNGFNMNIDDFDINSHYLLKLYNTNGDYVTLAFRVTDKYGNIGDWTQATGKNMNNDAIPFYYHDTSCETTGGFYYNKNDIKLSNIAAYNGNYISVDLDTQYKINANNHKIIIARGLIDSDGDMITPLPDGTVDGTETGSYYSCTGDLIDVNSVEYYANETNYVVPEVYGINGNNKFQIMLPTLMKEIPIHSALGGQKDNEYYYMKIFWDEDEHPDEYVSIPIRVTADIPQIEDVYGLSVTNRGSSLSVSWTNTTSQSAHGYLYDLYIDDVLVEENVEAGSYNFTGYSIIGDTHTVRVVAKWCEQTAEQSMAYEIQEPETEPEETIPSDTPDIPRDDKWVLINGQNTLPISIDGTIDSTTNAQIYYYTDVDMKSVIGYNDYYIALNGSDKYFTGTDTKIYVQRENSTTFTSKNVYDSYYKGQTLMNAAKMFSVPSDFTNGSTYYYVVRVAGNNGNTYKDFYFKVVPTSESGTVTNTGDWRLISGESELPVKMGTNSKLMGTVRFLDCPSTTETYTGTNTYDIVGYNGYYMSIIGNNTYYTGEATKISVSNASSTVLYAKDASTLNFTEKPIYDKVWPGQIIIKCEDTFTVEYAKTYYLLKVESGVNVTYIPVEITVKTGEVEVLGFQMNTNQNEGAVAEKSPSFRVVSKTSNVMTIKNKLYEVKKMGTVYAVADQIENLETQMNLDGVEANDYIAHVETTDKGKLTGYTTTESDTNYNTYFALTFIYKSYMYHTLEQNYAFRAYAVLDDGTVVYGHNIYTTNMYEIAENLYDNQKMGSKDAHDFLYKNILNLVDMDKNSSKIANAMFKAMGVRGYDDARYDLVAEMTTDIYNYARCRDGYTYQGREPFKCKNVEAELLECLNTAQTENGKATYESVYDWIYNETSNYSNKSGVPYKGCYRLVEYGWDSTIDDDFYTE